MLENLSEILGFLATIFGTVMALGYIPQIIKMIKRKSSADVSVMTYLILGTGVFVWLLYGVSLNNTALIISNFTGFVIVVILIITYFNYKK